MVKGKFSLLLLCLLSVSTTRFSAAGITYPPTGPPMEHPKKVIHVINNSSLETRFEDKLFKLRAAIPSGYFKGATPDDDVAYAESRIHPWKSSHCDAPNMNYPRWEGFPVTLCEYSDIGVTVKTYMLNADKAKQAAWTVTACRDAQALNMHACIDYLVSEVRNASSGGVFPIAGYIPEPQDGGVCYVFRDGVTVWTTLRKKWLKPKHKHCGNSDDEEMTQPLFKAWKFARIASTTRPEYKAAGGTRPVDGLKWIDVVRDLYQQAWNSDRNELMSAKAKGGKADGEFK